MGDRHVHPILRGRQRVEPAELAQAKRARSLLSVAYPRPRLFRLLDRARRTHPLIWVCAPAGSGKTTLVKSYAEARQLSTLWHQVDSRDSDIASFFGSMELRTKIIVPDARIPFPTLTPEYCAQSSTFAANYFHVLFSHVKRPGLLVIDGYHETSTEGTLHDVLRQVLEQIPTGVNVIVLSREEPPVTYTRLRSSGRMTVLGWDELKLTEPESVGIAKRRGKHGPLSQAWARRLHRETQGWAMGLALLIEQIGENSTTPASTIELTPQPLFDYFANEVFRHRSPETQDFLLKTAFLPTLSVALAEMLTGEADSEAILQDLVYRNCFTVQRADGSYEYHPLFHTFLEHRAAEVYSPDRIEQLKRRGAELVQQKKDAETITMLLQQSKDCQQVLPLVLAQAPMLVAQGRTQMLETWLQQLSASLACEEPWVFYWQGVCRLAVAPLQARQYFERAFALFERHNDAAPLTLAWSGIVESVVLGADDCTPLARWLDRYPGLTDERKPPSSEIEATGLFAYISGLLHARCDDPDLPVYAKRAEQLLHRETDINARFTRAATLVLYYRWHCEGAKIKKLLERLTPRASSPDIKPLARLYWYLCNVIHAESPEESLSTLNEALELAHASGIHALDYQLYTHGIWAQLRTGNILVARDLLQRMAALTGRGRIGDAFYHHCASIVSLHEGDIATALNEGRRAVDLAKEARLFFGVVTFLINLGHVYACQGDLDMATAVIAEARAIAARMQSKSMILFGAFADAAVLRLRGESQRTLLALQEALALAQETGALTPPPWCPRDHAVALFDMALESEICTAYVKSMIVKTRLPPACGLSRESWPWPVRVYTLGRFAVVTHDKPLTFSGRAQKKPLELLRALIAFGGRDVAAAKLGQALWPDTDGDMAEHALETNLYRLRKLLGDRCIEMNDGQLTLNSEWCWVDVWNFERLLEPADDIMPPATQVRRLLELYRGPFLDGCDTPAVLVQRERLHSKFLRAIGELGQLLESRDHYQVAIECYQKGIESDPLAEELYRRLMRCYHELKRPAEALAVYQRCHKTLTSVLSIEPTRETATLYREIQSGGSTWAYAEGW